MSCLCSIFMRKNISLFGIHRQENDQGLRRRHEINHNPHGEGQGFGSAPRIILNLRFSQHAQIRISGTQKLHPRYIICIFTATL